MKSKLSAFHVALIIFTITFLLISCGDGSDGDDATHQALIIPAVNPKFDSISSIAKSDAAAGTYTELMSTEFTYDVNSETITLANGLVSVGGNYFSITGSALNQNGVSEIYTVYSYVKDNDSSLAANELTTLAVAAEVNDANVTSFDAGVTEIASMTGLSEMDITAAMTEAQRRNTPNLQETLSELVSLVKGDASAVNLTALTDTMPPNMDKIAWGALLYDNWMKAPETAPKMGKPTGGASRYGENKKPAGLAVQVSDNLIVDNEGNPQAGFSRFARCKECHGWDQKGSKGSYEGRDVKNVMYYSTAADAVAASNGSLFSTRPTPASIDLTTDSFTKEGIIQQNADEKYANISNPVNEASLSAAASIWQAAGTPARNNHPDYSLNESTTDVEDDGMANDIVPTQNQIDALTAFLNYDGGKIDRVMSWDSSTDTQPGVYTFQNADIVQGEKRYADYCFRCHGAPNTEMMNPLYGEFGNVNGFFDNGGSIDQRHVAELFHMGRWGKAGAVMTRNRLGYPAATDVANLLDYLTTYFTEAMAIAADSNVAAVYTASTAIGNAGVGNVNNGKTLYDEGCAFCHAAHDGDENEEGNEDFTARCNDKDADHEEGRGHYEADGADNKSCVDENDALIPNLAPFKMAGRTMIPHLSMQAEIKYLTGVDENGAANGLMKGKANLTQQQINDLTAYFNSVGDLSVD